MTDPDRLTDATRADLAESVDALSRNLERGLLASERVKLREAARALRSTSEAGSARVIPPLSDEARARQPDSCWADCGDHDWYCCGGEWDDPERREAIFAGSDAALRSTPEAGTARAEEAGKRVVDEYPETLRRLGENQVTSSGPLPASPLLALAEELEARADEQSGDYQVPIGDWSVRRWSQLRAWKGATLAYRKAAALARDYATREESDDG